MHRILIFAAFLIMVIPLAGQTKKEVKQNKIKSTTDWEIIFKDGKANTYKSAYEEFDKDGHTTLKIEYGPAGEVLTKVTAKYDSYKNKIEETEFDASQKKGFKKTYKYNAFKDRTEELEYNSSGVLVKKTLFTYNTDGNKVSEIMMDASGTVFKKVTYTYNSEKLKSGKQTINNSNVPESGKSGNMNTIEIKSQSMDDLADILSLFKPITLEEMDHVKLLDRFDTKFTFKREELPLLLEQMKDDYRVLDVKGLRISRYETRYFDTHDFRLYLHHHNGKLNRYKIRFRKYTDSDTTFFEIKLKNSKGRMIKKRVQVNDIDDTIKGTAEELLLSKTKLPSGIFKPSLNVYYSRMTFVSLISNERITIDTGLNYSYLLKKYHSLIW